MRISLVVVGGFLLTIILSLVILDRQREPDRGIVVLGEEMARASEAERRRQLSGRAGSSPMPAMEYDFWRGELSLLNPKPVPLDAALSDLTERFAASDEATREKMRRAISMDEFYTLLSFGNRAAVFALRERSTAPLVNGLHAVAMIEAERTDPRDILWTLALLYHSAVRTGQDAEQLFHNSAALAEPRVARLLTGFLQRSAADKDLKGAWGYDEVETPDGPGLIGWAFDTYNPTYDLKKVAVGIADLVAADRYQPDDVQVATELPPVWLRANDKAALDQALRAVRAGASISGKLRPGEHADHENQLLLVFVVEAADESAAQTLLDLARTGKPAADAKVALAEGKLFCLVVATATSVGGKPVETPESLTRLSSRIAEILARAVHDPRQVRQRSSGPTRG